MNSTIAVALITAIATLSGGCIASVTGIIIQRRQIQLQATISVREHKERREVQQRKIRRDVYVKLLAQFEHAEKFLNDCWREPVPATSDEAELLRQKIYEQTYVFNSALIVVYLEGPKDVADAAGGMTNALRDETELINSCARNNIGKGGRLIDFRANDKGSLRSNLWSAEHPFITQAGKTLNDTTVL
jgi:hypothetical protein